MQIPAARLLSSRENFPDRGSKIRSHRRYPRVRNHLSSRALPSRMKNYWRLEAEWSSLAAEKILWKRGGHNKRAHNVREGCPSSHIYIGTEEGGRLGGVACSPRDGRTRKGASQTMAATPYTLPPSMWGVPHLYPLRHMWLPPLGPRQRISPIAASSIFCKVRNISVPFRVHWDFPSFTGAISVFSETLRFRNFSVLYLVLLTPPSTQQINDP